MKNIIDKFFADNVKLFGSAQTMTVLNDKYQTAYNRSISRKLDEAARAAAIADVNSIDKEMTTVISGAGHKSDRELFNAVGVLLNQLRGQIIQATNGAQPHEVSVVKLRESLAQVQNHSIWMLPPDRSGHAQGRNIESEASILESKERFLGHLFHEGRHVYYFNEKENKRRVPDNSAVEAIVDMKRDDPRRKKGVSDRFLMEHLKVYGDQRTAVLDILLTQDKHASDMLYRSVLQYLFFNDTITGLSQFKREMWPASIRIPGLEEDFSIPPQSQLEQEKR